MKRDLGELRIIGGEWRSRKVAFDANPTVGLRATPDRVRQTLFDWLSPLIEGAECLDLFAGSGALGLEALSRGARLCAFIDSGATQVADIRAALVKFAGQERAGAIAEINKADALKWLSRAGRYDVVFLDPPFGAGLLGSLLTALPQHLKPANRIYVEWRAGEEVPPLPPGFVWLKEKQAGQVSYGLLHYQAP